MIKHKNKHLALKLILQKKENPLITDDILIRFSKELKGKDMNSF